MMIQNKNEEYVIALYIRLSKEDEDVGIRYGKEESNSISNQRMLLYDYIRQHSEFMIISGSIRNFRAAGSLRNVMMDSAGNALTVLHLQS